MENKIIKQYFSLFLGVVFTLILVSTVLADSWWVNGNKHIAPATCSRREFHDRDSCCLECSDGETCISDVSYDWGSNDYMTWTYSDFECCPGFFSPYFGGYGNYFFTSTKTSPTSSSHDAICCGEWDDAFSLINSFRDSGGDYVSEGKCCSYSDSAAGGLIYKKDTDDDDENEITDECIQEKWIEYTDYKFASYKYECKNCTYNPSTRVSYVSETCESAGKTSCSYSTCYDSDINILCGNECNPVKCEQTDICYNANEENWDADEGCCPLGDGGYRSLADTDGLLVNGEFISETCCTGNTPISGFNYEDELRDEDDNPDTPDTCPIEVSADGFDLEECKECYGEDANEQCINQYGADWGCCYGRCYEIEEDICCGDSECDDEICTKDSEYTICCGPADTDKFEEWS